MLSYTDFRKCYLYSEVNTSALPRAIEALFDACQIELEESINLDVGGLLTENILTNFELKKANAEIYDERRFILEQITRYCKSNIYWALVEETATAAPAVSGVDELIKSLHDAIDEYMDELKAAVGQALGAPQSPTPAASTEAPSASGATPGAAPAAPAAPGAPAATPGAAPATPGPAPKTAPGATGGAPSGTGAPTGATPASKGTFRSRHPILGGLANLVKNWVVRPVHRAWTTDSVNNALQPLFIESTSEVFDRLDDIREKLKQIVSVRIKEFIAAAAKSVATKKATIPINPKADPAAVAADPAAAAMDGEASPEDAERAQALADLEAQAGAETSDEVEEDPVTGDPVPTPTQEQLIDKAAKELKVGHDAKEPGKFINGTQFTIPNYTIEHVPVPGKFKNTKDPDGNPLQVPVTRKQMIMKPGTQPVKAKAVIQYLLDMMAYSPSVQLIKHDKESLQKRSSLRLDVAMGLLGIPVKAGRKHFPSLAAQFLAKLADKINAGQPSEPPANVNAGQEAGPGANAQNGNAQGGNVQPETSVPPPKRNRLADIEALIKDDGTGPNPNALTPGEEKELQSFGNIRDDEPVEMKRAILAFNKLLAKYGDQLDKAEAKAGSLPALLQQMAENFKKNPKFDYEGFFANLVKDDTGEEVGGNPGQDVAPPAGDEPSGASSMSTEQAVQFARETVAKMKQEKPEKFEAIMRLSKQDPDVPQTEEEWINGLALQISHGHIDPKDAVSNLEGIANDVIESETGAGNAVGAETPAAAGAPASPETPAAAPAVNIAKGQGFRTKENESVPPTPQDVQAYSKDVCDWLDRELFKPAGIAIGGENGGLGQRWIRDAVDSVNEWDGTSGPKVEDVSSEVLDLIMTHALAYFSQKGNVPEDIWSAAKPDPNPIKDFFARPEVRAIPAFQASKVAQSLPNAWAQDYLKKKVA